MFWQMPCSHNDSIVSLVHSSNVGEPGLWLFRIDDSTIEPACQNKSEPKIKNV